MISCPIKLIEEIILNIISGKKRWTNLQNKEGNWGTR